MAIPTTGIPVNIPIDQVRAGLLAAMQIGKPADAELQVRFIKKGTGKRYYLGAIDEAKPQFPPPAGTLRLDPDGLPLNPNVNPSSPRVPGQRRGQESVAVEELVDGAVGAHVEVVHRVVGDP